MMMLLFFGYVALLLLILDGSSDAFTATPFARVQRKSLLASNYRRDGKSGTSDEDLYRSVIETTTQEEEEVVVHVEPVEEEDSLHPLELDALDITQKLGITKEQHFALANLTRAVVSWNEKINLVSRKDCCEEVIFSRHVLPSLALLRALPQKTLRVLDVGTGGGFPGLPLAICLPHVEFTLVDSVGKKVGVVASIAHELGLDNVRTHHGRVEEMADDLRDQHAGVYDAVLGRSVAPLSRFCFWVQELLRAKTGKVFYILGGSLEEGILSKTSAFLRVRNLLFGVRSDKRIVVLDQPGVQAVADESRYRKQKRGAPKLRNKPKRNPNKLKKGAWAKRDNSVPKQRGYENFNRYGY